MMRCSEFRSGTSKRTFLLKHFMINSKIGVGTSFSASAIYRFPLSSDENNVRNGEEMLKPDALKLVPTPKIADLMMALIVISFVLVLSLFPFASASAHSVVGGSGRISGQLLNGSHKNAPVAGQAVTLQMAQDGSARDLATTKTDARGSYTFPNLATDSAISYATYINYQGAGYTSTVVTLDKQPAQQVNLTVYDATSSTHNLAILRSTVLIQEPDAKKSTFTVSELFVFQNLGLQTYVGSLDASQGKPNALLFSLPKNARAISLDSGFAGYRSLQVTGGFATNAAVLPGSSEYAFSFEVPYTSSVYDFQYSAQYPTVDFSFMVAPSIHASSGALTAQGIQTANDHPYQLFKGSQLLPNQQLHVNFEGLPSPTNSSSSLNLKLVWLVVGLLILLAIIATVSVLSRLQDRKKRRPNGKHAGKGKPTEKRSAREPRPEERKQELMQELLDLDKAYEAGKLNKSTYQERRARAKARLRTFMSEQEATRR
jgi:hypothetical protein